MRADRPVSWDAAPPITYAFPPPLTHRCDVCGRKCIAPADPKRPWCAFDTDICDGVLLPRTDEPKRSESP